VKRALLALLAVGACVPDLDQRTSIVDKPEVLAVVAEPAEAKPGTAVTYHALLATPGGEPVNAPLAWSYCTDPKPPTEDDAVSVLCLSDAGVALTVGAGGLDATGTLPMDTCMQFGPNPPGQGFRPRDPDPTGGFYQPVGVRGTVDGAAVTTFGLDRIHCDLANAPPEIVTSFRMRYTDNQNPPALALDTGGAPVDGATVAAGATIPLHASWPAAAAERYVSYDPSSVALVDRIESLRVSFYATAGRFDTDAAGVDEADAASITAVDDAWTAPAGPGPVVIWTVFRDSRGGAAVARYTVTVR
jgi:hypothetical protein